jgi:rubredoxin
MTTPTSDKPFPSGFGAGISMGAFFTTVCPECGSPIIKEGGPGGLWECGECGYEHRPQPTGHTLSVDSGGEARWSDTR